jgi:acetyl-CoA carboxylase biotin carboxyl carrier protein
LADDAPKGPDPFDVRTIKDLVALMSRHDLSEIDLKQGEHRIRLRRGQRTRAVPVAAIPPPSREAEGPREPQAAATPAAATAPARHLVEIKSPTVGTFYAAPSPDVPPYVTVGSRVTPTTVVCQVEAMKIFNEIQAECSGIIAEVLVKNKEPVEFGTVLFRVDPTG